MRYFMSDDPEVKAQALGETREVMGTLVSNSLYYFRLSQKQCEPINARSSNPSYSSQGPNGDMVRYVNNSLKFLKRKK
jgi:hypothetical protein